MAQMRQQMAQKMLQKLSPQQIQLMKLLQVPTVKLAQRIKEELEANPALEEGFEDSIEANDLEEERDSETEEFELDDYLNEYIEDDPGSYKYKSSNYSQSDEDEYKREVPVHRNFRDHLDRQMKLLNIKDERRKLILEQVVGNIDDDGYLRRDAMSLSDDLLFSHNMTVEAEEIEEIITMVQEMEPAGVAARDLQENLVLQMRAKIAKNQVDEETTDLRKIGLKLLEEHFDYFSKKHYDKLINTMDISREQLKDVIDEILKLNPKPASGFRVKHQMSESQRQYIVPDFIIENRDGELDVKLNVKNAPELQINNQYMTMLKTYNEHNKGKKNTASKKNKEAVVFIKKKIESAKWFIDAIKQRQATMYKTMYSILQFQYQYFLSGDERKLKPMILKDIAEMTGLDLSTISRVTNSKYVQTEFGTKLLKDFFSESVQASDGSEVSTLEVKKILQNIVEEEDKSKPFSDEKLRLRLKEKGYPIARRTVAKYRGHLGIPVARLRKEL